MSSIYQNMKESKGVGNIFSREQLSEEKLRNDILKYQGNGLAEVADIKSVGIVEYLQRLRTDRGRYLANIVHQGVRDHYGMSEHSGNIGEYGNEIDDILSCGEFRSTVRRNLENVIFLKAAEDEIREIMLKEDLQAEDATKKYLFRQYSEHRLLTQGVEDHMALHFSSNAVLDMHYGAETHNECFAVFSESWSLKDKIFWSRAVKTDSSRDTQYNDVYVWPNKDEPNTLGVEASLLFLPRDNKVGKDTGSLFEIQDNKAIIDYDSIELLEKEIGQIRKLREDIVKKLNLRLPALQLLEEGTLKQNSSGCYELTDYAKIGMKEKVAQDILEYLKIFKLLNIDVVAFENIFQQYWMKDDLAEDKQEMEHFFTGSELEEVKKIISVILKKAKFDDVAYELEYFWEIKNLGLKDRQSLRDKLVESGFDINILDSMAADEAKKSKIQVFIKKHIGSYNYLVTNGSAKGLFFKKAKNTIDAKEYYERIVVENLKDIKITEVRSKEYDLVEYRGKSVQGDIKVVRVVYYTVKDPNIAVRDFYEDIGIDFDDKVIGDNEGYDIKNQEIKHFDDVSYRYDLEQLKKKLVAKIVGE